MVPLSWLRPDLLRLPLAHEIWAVAIAGGAAFGLGAYLNRGCVFGTFVQLTGGNLNYLATLVGMPLGGVAATLWLGGWRPALTEAAVASSPGGAAFFWLLMAAMLLLAAMLERPRRAAAVMLTMGIGGGLLFAAVEGWSFSSVLSGAVYRMLGLRPTGPAALATFCTLAMVTGGVAAAVVQGQFSIRRPRLRPLGGSLVGGALMGGAAVIVPGGNDGLLLSAIPALALHALPAWLAMVVVMLLLLRLLPNQENFPFPGPMKKSGC